LKVCRGMIQRGTPTSIPAGFRQFVAGPPRTRKRSSLIVITVLTLWCMTRPDLCHRTCTTIKLFSGLWGLSGLFRSVPRVASCKLIIRESVRRRGGSVTSHRPQLKTISETLPGFSGLKRPSVGPSREQFGRRVVNQWWGVRAP
jgi:hypothetical protein